MIRRFVYIILFMILTQLLLISSISMGDNEPNDTLDNPELIGEGTFSGEVYYGVLTDNDEDVYRISVPSGNKITVTAKNTNTDSDSSITIESYDHNKQELGVFDGIWLFLDTAGETGSDSWYNNEDSSKDIYLKISGDGSYEITINFEEELGDEAFIGICIAIVVIVVVVIIVIIILIIKYRNKSAAKYPAQQPQYPQYPPQYPQYPQQPQYPQYPQQPPPQYPYPPR